MAKKRNRETETDSGGRLTTFAKSRSLGKILKWFGVIITLLTLGGFLVGYGIWIGGTSSTLTSIKDDVKDLKDEDTKTAANLMKFVEKLNQRLQGFELLLTKHQSSIDALHSEIRIRHEDSSYLNRIIENTTYKNQPIHRLSRRKRQQLEEEARKAAQTRAARASDAAIGNAHKALPTVTQEDPLEGLSF